jgi:3-deoxy-D-manno-octulosonic-acid transferase
VFGPNTEKYPEADLAIKAGVSLRINNVTDFENALAHYLKSNEIQLHRLACKSFIEENSGATDMVLKSIENKLILQKK